MKYLLILLTILFISCSSEQPTSLVNNPNDTTGKGYWGICWGYVPTDSLTTDYCTYPALGKWQRCGRSYYIPVTEPQGNKCKFVRHYRENCK